MSKALLAVLLLLESCKASYRDDYARESGQSAGAFVKPFQNGFPEKISSTGLFENGEPQRLNSELVNYDVRVPLWSDGAHKQRYAYVPTGNAIALREEKLDFPVGSTFIKNFFTASDEMHPIETRVITLTADNGWQFATYVYDADGSGVVNTRPRVINVDGQNYRVPSEKECRVCHDSGMGPILGFVPSQIKFDAAMAEVTDLAKLRGLFEDNVALQKYGQDVALPIPSDESLSIDKRIRSYMAVNCASCHNPEGPKEANQIDLRFEAKVTNLVEEKMLTPGKPDESEIWKRVSASTDRMPPLIQRADSYLLENLPKYIIQFDSLKR